ncbi:hypothetical protein D3C86_1571190 [compost metagenome]
MGNAGKDHARLFLAGENGNGKPQARFGTGDKGRCIARLAHGACRHRPHAALLETTQALAETLQCLPAAFQRQRIQGVPTQPLGQSHGLAQCLDRLDGRALRARYLLTDGQAKSVGTQVDGCNQRVVAFHAPIPDVLAGTACSGRAHRRSLPGGNNAPGA